ncbi:MAG TPA: GNAT family N-acetyltransferase [Tepidisphaeraceae bacterium]|nr:GNAT family N-acetyltransferase [Tepidisphaeraceae bacterium]
MHVEATRGQFHISSDPAQIDVRACHDLLRATYWASHRTPEQVEAALQGSLVVGLFDGERQIGMARAVTDGVTFSWICDVVVENAYRGRGLGSWLIESLLAHPRVAPTRAVLVTKDAQ